MITRAPIPAASIAWGRTLPTASTTTSAPAGISSARRADQSSGLSTSVAPSARATGARAALGSTTMIRAAPAAWRTAVNRQPIAPAPKTTTDSPGRSAARFVPLTTQASGSTRAASSAGTSSEIG